MSDDKNDVNLVDKTPTADEYWEGIAYRFSDLKEAIFLTKFETAEQAIGVAAVGEDGKKILASRRLLWDDAEAGPIKPWFQIPYDPDRNVAEWDELQERAECLAPNIQQMIDERDLSPQSLFIWGQFSEIGAIFENALDTFRKVPQHLKASAVQGITAQKVWYSKIYIALESPNTSRGDVDGKIIQLIEEIISGKRPSVPKFNESWFRRILPKDDLAASFKQNKLPRASTGKNNQSIETLARNNTYSIPPTDLAFYHL